MYNLPDEVLFEVFEYCTKEDLLNLTLVCKRFNEIISSNPNTMQYLRIDIKRNHQDCEWNGTRKYSHLLVHKMHSELPKIIESTKNDLVLLKLMYVSMKAMEFKNLLFYFTKLNYIALMNVEFEFTDECFAEPLPNLDLTNIVVSTDRKILKMLMECQTDSFTTYRIAAGQAELDIVKKFLLTQKKLTKLYMYTFHHDCEIFLDDTLNTVDFRLKKFKLQGFKAFDTRNYLAFLKNHRESLEHAEIRYNVGLWPNAQFCNTEIMNVLGTFSNLKRLELDKVYLNFEPMPYVKTLTLNGMGYTDSWYDKFPNVTNLRLNYCTKITDVQHLKFLETLEICSTENMDEITLPLTVKNLTLAQIWPKNERPFNYEHHNIENLRVEFCIGADWVGHFLSTLTKNLKHLWIERTFLSRNRRFARLFEKEPHLKDKADRFVFIDYKDDLDEDSIASGEEEEEEKDSEWGGDFDFYEVLGVPVGSRMYQDYNYEPSEYETSGEDEDVFDDEVDEVTEDDENGDDPSVEVPSVSSHSEGPSNESKKMKLDEN